MKNTLEGVCLEWCPDFLFVGVRGNPPELVEEVLGPRGRVEIFGDGWDVWVDPSQIEDTEVLYPGEEITVEEIRGESIDDRWAIGVRVVGLIQFEAAAEELAQALKAYARAAVSRPDQLCEFAKVAQAAHRAFKDAYQALQHGRQSRKHRARYRTLRDSYRPVAELLAQRTKREREKQKRQALLGKARSKIRSHRLRDAVGLRVQFDRLLQLQPHLADEVLVLMVELRDEVKHQIRWREKRAAGGKRQVREETRAARLAELLGEVETWLAEHSGPPQKD